MMNKSGRREFLTTVAAAGAAASLMTRPGAAQQSGTLPVKIGLIGCGWWGLVDLQAAYRAGGVETVALCDADPVRLKAAAAEVAKLQPGVPRQFKDYRQLLETSGIEAVIIATPPHWHALQFIAACEKGLAVYCEKPLSYDVREGRAMVEAAKKRGNVVQIGFQRRQSDTIRQAAKYIREGRAGRILQVEAQINYDPGLPAQFAKNKTNTLDWEMWCGPAPKLPLTDKQGHFVWRFERAYGNGHMVDWGIHWHDAIRFVLGESMPRQIHATGGLYHLQGQMNTPDLLTVAYDFAACPVVWRHRLWGVEEFSPETNIGMFFYGEKETVFLNDEKMIVIPKGKGAERRTIEAKTDMSRLHMAEFLRAVKDRSQSVSCTPEDAYRSTATVQLGMISHYAGEKITWDMQKEQLGGGGVAQKLLKREYRTPYKHPA